MVLPGSLSVGQHHDKIMKEAPFLVIAVDGGAASGKSTTSRAVAEELDLLYVDTGSYYRAITAAALQDGLNPDAPGALQAFLQKLRLHTEIDGRDARICVNGRRIAPDELRAAAVNRNVSRFAARPELRQSVLAQQRHQVAVAREAGFLGVILEGRDIGSVVFPDAPFKFFLEADDATRIRRRSGDGEEDTIPERDAMDRERPAAPLTCPADATRIDTTTLTLPEVVAEIVARVRREWNRRGSR